MPKFLEKKLKKQYPDNPSAVYGTMNKLGFMHGNKETAKGKAAEKKHMSKKSSRSRAVTGSSNTPRASVTGSTVSVAPGLSSSKNVHKKSKMSKRKMFTKNIMAGARY